MIALRVVFRMGWALPNPATRMNGDRAMVPFAYLEPATAATTQTVTFTVKDGTGESAKAVEGAVVNVNGARKKTTSAGTAAFNLREGSWPYTVKKDGHVPSAGTATVASAAVAVAVALPEA